MAFLNWLLGDVGLPVAVVAAIGLAVDWFRQRGWLLVLLISSTLLMHRIHAYEKARSRTPGGSTNSPGGLTPSRSSGATGPGVEASPLAGSAPPPVPPQTSVGAGDSPPSCPRTHRATPQAPAGGGHTSATPSTGLPPSGDR